ncbi:adropin [Monodelphis domestica]|uniref:adropin n=1 Tax=Monodelphis domestica TaxID=13616 RepID=UPI0004435007|nr:adropin [Monodelphis domestica]
MGAGLSTGAIIAISFNGLVALLLLLLCTIVCRACLAHPMCTCTKKSPTTQEPQQALQPQEPQQSQQPQEPQQSQQPQGPQQSQEPQPRHEGSHLLQP